MQTCQSLLCHARFRGSLGGNNPAGYSGYDDDAGCFFLAISVSGSLRLIGIPFLVIPFFVFFGYFGLLRQALIFLVFILGIAILVAILQIFSAKAELDKHRSMPARLELTQDRLTIDEPTFNINRRGRIIAIVPTHVEYALADLSGFSVETLLFDGTLKVRMANRLSNQHLRGRSLEQIP